MSTNPPQDPWVGGAEGSDAGGPEPGGYPPPPPPPAYPSPPAYPQPPGYPPPPPPGNYPPPPPTWEQGGGWQPSGGPAAGGYLAGWWYRVGASLLDGLIVGIPIGILLAVGHVNNFFARDAIEGIVSAVYVTLMLANFGGQTVGNKALSTRTADSSTGAPPDIGKATIRSLVSFVLALTVIGGLLDILWPLWDPLNQTLHDKAAGTVVLRVTRYQT